MNISQLVTPARVVAELNGTTSLEVLSTLAHLLADELKQAPAQEILDLFVERERLGSTAVGKGVAIPHGRLAGLSHPVAALGRSSRGVGFHALDGEPVYLFIALLSPLTPNELHVRALSVINHLLHRETLRNRLRETTESASLFRILVAEEEH